jgi:hypothetical protein
LYSPAIEETCLPHLLDYHDSDFWLTQFSFTYSFSITTFTSHLNTNQHIPSDNNL